MACHRLLPAYSRDYKGKKAILADLADGKDFVIYDYFSRWNGKPMSIQDMTHGDTIVARYNRCQKQCLLSAKEVSAAITEAKGE